MIQKYTDPNPIGTGPFTEIVKFTMFGNQKT